jgi:hypothetical protein
MAFSDDDFKSVYDSEINRAGAGRARGMDFVGDGLEIIGVENAIQRVNLLGQKIVRAGMVSSARFARLVLFTSLKHVPYDTGELFDSGYIKRIHDKAAKRYIYEVGYDTHYAALVHENPYGWQFQQGKGPFSGDLKMDHWLTNAIEAEKSAFPGMVKGEIIDHIAQALTGNPVMTAQTDDEGLPGEKQFNSWEDVLANWQAD